MLKLEKIQYLNSIFYLNYAKYEKKALMKICLLHWEKRFDWIKENNLFERLFFI